MTNHLLDEQVQDALDGRLTESELASLREHIRSCEACATGWAAVARLKQWTANLPTPALPVGLPAAVAGALDAEDRRSRSARQGSRRLSLAAGVAGLAALAAFTAWFASRERLARSPSLPSEVASDFRQLRSGRLTLSLQTSDSAALERRLARGELGFPARVFDLAMMQQHLLGGSLERLAGRPAALVAYSGEDGSLLVCRMLRGALAELPEPQGRREHDGIAFLIYADEELTLVFWPEGEVLCVLVGDGPADAVVSLALAKALKDAA